jgi:hypothetical protein
MGVTQEDWVECPPGHLSDDHELKQPGYCPAVFFGWNRPGLIILISELSRGF